MNFALISYYSLYICYPITNLYRYAFILRFTLGNVSLLIKKKIDFVIVRNRFKRNRLKK